MLACKRCMRHVYHSTRPEHDRDTRLTRVVTAAGLGGLQRVQSLIYTCTHVHDSETVLTRVPTLACTTRWGLVWGTSK
jgi:hypothetical protein